MPYPSGAIVFHSDGIAKALGLGIIASFPILFGTDNIETGNTTSSKANASSPAPTEPTVVVDDEDYELADVNDLTSGEFDI